MRNRTLTLKRETLADLSSDELVAVAGGQAQLTHDTCVTCNVTYRCTHGYSFDSCRTVPVNDCLSKINA